MSDDSGSSRVGLAIAVVSVIAALVSAGAAVWANTQASKSLEIAQEANRIAADANRLAKEQQMPRPRVIHQFTVQRQDDEIAPPCKSEGYLVANGEYEEEPYAWRTDLAVAFDITNFGGAPTSLAKVSVGDAKADIPIPGPKADLFIFYFNSETELRHWFVAKGGPGDSLIDLMMGTYTLTGPPTQIEVGETKRLVLRVSEWVVMPVTMGTPQDVHDGIRSSESWTSKVTFQFSDGTLVTTPFPVARPFMHREPEGGKVSDFQPCGF